MVGESTGHGLRPRNPSDATRIPAREFLRRAAEGASRKWYCEVFRQRETSAAQGLATHKAILGIQDGAL
jgi:hypothetical protein